MIYKKILLKDIDPKYSDDSLALRIYISDRNESVSLRPGMLVCPGGAYAYCSPREAEPIAFRFLAEGFNCFILDYSVNKKYPAPHLDLALAFSYIRQHEKEFDLIPNSLSIDSVTLMGVQTHGGSRDVICGEDKELEKKLDVPSHITSKYPPTFIWGTKDDQVVPYVNSYSFAEELGKNNVFHEYHMFDSGWHGSSLCNRSCYRKEDITERMKDIRDWASLAADFIFKVLDKRL